MPEGAYQESEWMRQVNEMREMRKKEAEAAAKNKKPNFAPPPLGLADVFIEMQKTHKDVLEIKELLGMILKSYLLMAKTQPELRVRAETKLIPPTSEDDKEAESTVHAKPSQKPPQYTQEQLKQMYKETPEHDPLAGEEQ